MLGTDLEFLDQFPRSATFPEPVLHTDHTHNEGPTIEFLRLANYGRNLVSESADLVLLSGDPTQVPPEEIKDIKVEMTIIGGRVVWET